jgi:hypothetical protein
MTPKLWLAVACAVVGIPLAAYGLAERMLLVAFGGLALVLTFVAILWQWISGVGRPQAPIRPAANSAWAEFNRDAGDGASERKP